MMECCIFFICDVFFNSIIIHLFSRMPPFFSSHKKGKSEQKYVMNELCMVDLFVKILQVTVIVVCCLHTRLFLRFVICHCCIILCHHVENLLLVSVDCSVFSVV